MAYRIHIVSIASVLTLIFSCSCSFRLIETGSLVTQRRARGGSVNEQIDSCQLEGRTSSFPNEPKKHSIILSRQGVLWVIPVLASLLAFLSFKKVTHDFHAIVKAISHDTWSPSSEAELSLQTEVITQVVNGPVITSISVLFATLVSTTISFLHDRQLKMKSLFSQLMDELQILNVILMNLPEPLVKDVTLFTTQYAALLLQNIEDGGETGGLTQGRIDGLTETPDSVLFRLMHLFQVEMTSKRPSPIASMAFECLTRIQQARSGRQTVLQTKFPAMHYATMWLLAVGICLSFLVATDSSLLIFESLQVRILWTILIGAFTSLAVVCYDLSSPFVGAYQITTPSGTDE